jgi:hypothetical protein
LILKRALRTIPRVLKFKQEFQTASGSRNSAREQPDGMVVGRRRASSFLEQLPQFYED